MIDVTKVTVNEEAKEVLISGVDLDSIWCFKDEPDENAECNEVSYKFDISLAGVRKYLYLVTKNIGKCSKFSNMHNRLLALTGQIISLSPNFLVKDEA